MPEVAAAPVSVLRHGRPDRLDLYTLRMLVGPFMLSTCVLLLAFLLKRLLALFELAAATGASSLLVMKMIANLVPHFLGLAVLVAFFAAMFMATARSGDDNELDAMLATGRSIARLAVPFFAVALGLCAFNLFLFGYLQPMTRYQYHVREHEALQTGWDGKMEANRFVTARRGITLGADAVGADGHELNGVFVQRRDASTEEVVTAERGRLVPSADGKRLLLALENGMIVRDEPGGSVRVVHFGQGQINEDFTAVPPPFRERGDTVNELTLPELRGVAAGSAVSVTTPAERAGEYHGRLVRTLLPLVLPLLALPLGMAAKRGRRAPGTVFATLALLALYESLQFGQSLAQSGRAPVLLAVWSPLLVFTAFGLWLFRSSLQWPGDNPVMRAVSAIEAAFGGLQRHKKAKTK